MAKSLKLNLFWRELILFGLTQILGIIAARRYLSVLGDSALAAPDISFKFTSTDFIFSALAISFFLWAILKRSQASRMVFKIFFWVVLIGGAQIVLSAWFSPLSSLLIIGLLMALMVKARSILVQNFLVLLAIAGVGLVLGLSITPLMAVWVLLIFSFYDIIAVYVTKHMVKMAQGMAEAGAVFGFIIPMEWSGFHEHVSKIKKEKMMILGSGDIALPLILATSLMRVSIAHSWVTTLFAMGGLFITHLLFVSQRQRRPMAALPPIAMMAIVGYLVALILPL